MSTPEISPGLARPARAVSFLRLCIGLGAQDLATTGRGTRRSRGSTAGAASGPVRPIADRGEESLFTELSRDYPELSGRAVTEVLDRAWTAVWRSNSFAPEDVEGLVVSIARDQLDLARERLLAATSRVDIPNQRRESSG